MELTLGDLILIEISLASFLKGIDLSMMAGQQLIQIIGKLEYQISRISEAAAKQSTTGLQPPVA